MEIKHDTITSIQTDIDMLVCGAVFGALVSKDFDLATTFSDYAISNILPGDVATYYTALKQFLIEQGYGKTMDDMREDVLTTIAKSLIKKEKT